MFAVLTGCAGDERSTGMERFGLIDAPQDYALVLAALKITKRLLPTDAPKLVAGWLGNIPAGAWSVFAVTSEGGGREEIMAIHKECHCILVRAEALDSWFDSHVGRNQALVSVDLPELLAYMLLHEAGHIVRDHSIEATDDETAAASAFNREATDQKERESQADLYAATAIRIGLAEKRSDRGLIAAGVAMSLSQLAWNLQVHRSLDYFGATVTQDPAVFWDSGLSHPNLEWRVLKVHAMISDTEVSHQLLEDFEKARQDGGGVLFLPEGGKPLR